MADTTPAAGGAPGDPAADAAVLQSLGATKDCPVFVDGVVTAPDALTEIERLTLA